MAVSPYVFDVDEADFAQAVIAKSHEVPVVVDFWAEWCGPCRTLGPVLERLVDARGGEVLLAKLDTDANQRIASAFGIRGIPAVKAFRDGKMVAEFVGAIPERNVAAFLDQLVPTEVDRAVASAASLAASDPAAAEAEYRRALELDPRHRTAAVGLAALVVERDPAEALTLVAPHRPHLDAEAVAARATLAQGGGDLDALAAAAATAPDDTDAQLAYGRALAAAGDYAAALDRLLATVETTTGDPRSAARDQVLSIFKVLGDGDQNVVDARRRLARALY